MLTTSTLQSIFWPRTQENSFLKQLFIVLGGAILLSLSSQLSIPLQPVPLTFQSITVILLGMALGPRLGFYAVLSYLTAGFLGLPVFANFTGGLHVFFGPTAGYLMGFLPAAALSGFLAQQGFAKSVLTSFISALLGTVIIFSLGVIVLSHYTGWHNAFLFGVKPFMLTELIKLSALALFIPRCWKNG